MKSLILLLVILLTACVAEPPEQAFVDTIVAQTLAAIYTPTPAPPVANTPAPTEIPLNLAACVEGANSLNIRSGPGTEFEPVGYLLEGACVTLTERNADASWAKTDRGWLSTHYLRADQDFRLLPDTSITEVAPTMTPITIQLIPPTILPTPDVRVVQGEPHEFLLKLEDLPDPYYLSGPDAIQPYTNAEILGVRGVREGKAYLEATRRKSGWIAWYRAGARVENAPQEIGGFVIMYETSEGARLAVSPQWHRIYEDVKEGDAQFIDVHPELGDSSLVYMYRDRQPNGEYRVDYDIEFVYHNVLVLIVGRDWEAKLTPAYHDYILSAAKTVLAKLEEAPLALP